MKNNIKKGGVYTAPTTTTNPTDYTYDTRGKFTNAEVVKALSDQEKSRVDQVKYRDDLKGIANTRSDWELKRLAVATRGALSGLSGHPFSNLPSTTIPSRITHPAWPADTTDIPCTLAMSATPEMYQPGSITRGPCTATLPTGFSQTSVVQSTGQANPIGFARSLVPGIGSGGARKNKRSRSSRMPSRKSSRRSSRRSSTRKASRKSRRSTRRSRK